MRRGLVLFGKPAAGKGTQGRILDAMPGFVHVETGSILRSVAEQRSEVGQQVRRILRQGDLVPDDLVLELFEQHLDARRERGQYRPDSDVLVLNGIPRTIGQASRLVDRVTVKSVVHLRGSDEEFLERALGRAHTDGRSDDRRETFRRRLAAFAQQTAPVLDFYPAEIRTEIDSLRHPVLVHDAIVHIVIRSFLTEGGGSGS